MRVIIISMMVVAMGLAAGCGNKQTDKSKADEGESKTTSESMSDKGSGTEDSKSMQKTDGNGKSGSAKTTGTQSAN